MKKSTNKELVQELEARNHDHRYDELISNASGNMYHDFKNPSHVICGKMQLAKDLQGFPELSDIRQMVIDGDYDEEMDADDKNAMRSEVPPNMWPMLGL